MCFLMVTIFLDVVIGLCMLLKQSTLMPLLKNTVQVKKKKKKKKAIVIPSEAIT